jgi:F-type H+-transporting ATPase subunit b
MDQILGQLVELLVGSVPTVVIFVLLVIAYTQLVHGPLMSTLAERRARTTGAIEKAKQAIASAEERTAHYEHKMREARVALMKAREARMHEWQLEREAALDHARAAAQEAVVYSLKDIAESAEEARRIVAASVDELAAQVVEAVLPAGVK